VCPRNRAMFGIAFSKLGRSKSRLANGADAAPDSRTGWPKRAAKEMLTR
jgi:hypothetical protein